MYRRMSTAGSDNTCLEYACRLAYFYPHETHGPVGLSDLELRMAERGDGRGDGNR